MNGVVPLMMIFRREVSRAMDVDVEEVEEGQWGESWAHAKPTEPMR